VTGFREWEKTEGIGQPDQAHLGAVNSPNRPPNILLLTDDQHRWDWFGDTGTVPALRTPHMDALRAGGTVFTNAWSNCPICVPTRFTWYSGLYARQGRQGLLTNSVGWPDQVSYLPQLLQAHGYQTALIGKLHHVDGRGVTRDLATPEYVARARARGFDHVWEVGGRSQAAFHDCAWTHHLRDHGLLDAYRRDLIERRADRCWNEPYRPSILPAEHQVDTLISDRACAWLREVSLDRPFFLHASFCAPHFPLDPPRDWFGRHRPSDMPPPVAVADPAERAYWQEQRAAYADLIAFVDHQMGRVLAALAERGLDRHTVVMFASDHGDRLGDQGCWHKSQPQDGSCRVPLVVSCPGTVPVGTRRDGFVGAVDVAVTLLEVAGLTAPLNHLLPESPGRSFWNYARGAVAEPPRRRVFAETGGFQMIVDADWKYVRRADGREELYDRRADPHDLQNVATAVNPAVLTAARLALIEELASAVAPNPAGYWQDRDVRRHNAGPRPAHHPKHPAGNWWQTPS
jgi:choline-sulfatase